MAAAVPQIEPLKFRSGETVLWTKSLADYSYADGWRLTYYLRGKQSLDISTIADTDGRGFAAAITSAQTSALEAGQYWNEGRVAYDDQVFVVYPRTPLLIEPDFSDPDDVAAGYDGRTHARKMLDAIESAAIGAGGTFIVEYTIAGERTVRLYTPEEKTNEWAFWKNIVAAEEKNTLANRGQRTGVYIRFRNP